MLKNRPQPVTDWDYRTADTKEFTHGIHPYPAMMIPQVARRLILEYGNQGDTLFDPYCGTGTTLLEAMLAGRRSVGTDLNPLARLISKVKTTPVDVERLDLEIEKFVAFGLNATMSPQANVELPDIPNIDYWFGKQVQMYLALIRSYVNRIADEHVADFFMVAFSLTIRKVSWTKNSEFKLVRIPPDRMETHNPDVFSTMIGILNDNREAIVQLMNTLGERAPSRSIHGFDTVTGVPSTVIASNSVGIVVTSPPYGDSKTTVAYGQFSRLSSQWLGYISANRVDRELMGGRKFTGDVSFGYDELDAALYEIADVDVKRSLEVASFFFDYHKSIRNVSSVVSLGGYVCYVVGNRTVKNVEVPTAEATAAFFEMHGFKCVDLIRRNIPNKRMPSLNSPTNVPGKIGKTMKAEFIIVCRKVLYA